MGSFFIFYMEHPALDAARKGFIDALSEKGFKENEQISVDFQNAQPGPL